MASDNPKPWGGGVGNWALEAERAEAEELAAAAEPQSFPSLKEAAKTKTKKKKAITYSLSDFVTGTHVGPGGARQTPSVFESKGLTADEQMRLPTGPKQRSPEELEQGRLGGGFRNYGSYDVSGPRASGGPRRGDGDGSWGRDGGRRGHSSGFDEEARRGPASRGPDLEQMPSRADEDDNWAAGKRSVAPVESASRESRNRYQDLGGTMRADEVDDWSVGKKPIVARSSSGFGSGFRDSVGAAPDSDRWVRGGGGGSPYNGERERPRLVLDPPRKDREGGVVTEPVKARPSPFGSARPREEVLAEKGVDWKNADSELDVKKTSGPIGSQSSRPSSAHSGSSDAASQEVKPRRKVNPFGDAKPREVLLEERGKDWRKMDLELEHRAIERTETEQEKLFKEEITHLKREIKKIEEASLAVDTAEHAAELGSLEEQVRVREQELEQLTHELDNKVRFSQKVVSERQPGSGGSRSSAVSERPSSRSGLLEESRNADFIEGPRSRGGAADTWSRSDERRGSQTGREGGFFGSRDMDRSKNKDRW